MRFARSSSRRKRKPSPWPLAIWSAILLFNVAVVGQFGGWYFGAFQFEHIFGVGLCLAAIPIVIAGAWTIRRALRTRALSKLDYLDCPYCGYRLEGLAKVDYCPECGEVFSPEVLRLAWAAKLGVEPAMDTPSTPSPPPPHTPPASPTAPRGTA